VTIRHRKSGRWVSWGFGYLALTTICSTVAGLVLTAARGQVLTGFDKVFAALVGRF
jgi:hypothetical protein